MLYLKFETNYLADVWYYSLIDSKEQWPSRDKDFGYLIAFVCLF